MKTLKISKPWLKKQFTTFPTKNLIKKTRDYSWTGMVITMIGTNFYYGIIDHPAYMSTAIWQLCTLVFYWLLQMTAEQGKRTRDFYRSLLDSGDDLYKAQDNLINDMQASLLKMAKENADLKKQNGI